MTANHGTSVELFTGAGGLALGLEQSGWRHLALIERDPHACATIRHNKQRGIAPVSSWRLLAEDVRKVHYAELFEGVDLVAGGPPCQPFSLGGKHRGRKDQRNMFPEAVRAVRELAPKAFIFENVKGLLRQSFSTYFGYIVLQLSYPEVVMKSDEPWSDHLARLERHHTSGRPGLSYKVVYRLLNAADYGIPQNRRRVFIVGLRSDLRREWSFPEPTHGFDALLRAKWVSGEYWDEHRVAKARRPSVPEKLRKRIERLASETPLFPSSEHRWQTVRDALAGLPASSRKSTTGQYANHDFREGARVYPGHTGSPLDGPAKTLKAGDHGVPGGENMLRMPDGRVRYFTVRESARLQTFQDNYEFCGSWTESMRQLGNAVPVRLAKVVGRGVFREVRGAHDEKTS